MNDITSPQTAADKELIGKTPAMQQLKRRIGKLAKSQAAIYISGESGSGKERVARLIHRLGPRRHQPFVAVNCGAIPSELMESELFGHRKGSFTGAMEDRKGLFREASGGTLFLDEVADLPLSMQVKLLRAIQEKTVRPLGEASEVAVNLRFLCATHRNLHAEMVAGRFRQDLYYRINVIEAHVPALRERSEDIPMLIDHFLSELESERDMPPRVAHQAMNALQHYSYPGNVRELENILERALTLCESDVIEVEHLHLPSVDSLLAEDHDGHYRSPRQPLDTYLQKIEKREILRALERTHWNRTAAAEELGMTFRALRYRLDKLELNQQANA